MVSDQNEKNYIIKDLSNYSYGGRTTRTSESFGSDNNCQDLRGHTQDGEPYLVSVVFVNTISN